MDHAFNHAHFCMYDDTVRVKTVHVKVLKEEDSKYRVGHSSSLDRSALFLFSPLENAYL